MRILITGGAGFIGSNFVCQALEKDYQIINVDKLTYAGDLKNLGVYLNHPNHQFYKEDICNKSEIEKLLALHQPDIILHMAAESHVDRSIDCADEFIRTNIIGTQVLLDCALNYYKNLQDKSRFKFLHLSTDEVFGALGAEGSFNESMPYLPNSPYAASKASSDHLVRAYHRTYGLPTIIVNSSNNYGPRQYPEKLIPLTILNALESKPLPVYGEGKQVRDWLFVNDHVDALICLIQQGKIGESYCIGSSNELNNLRLVQTLCQILNEQYPAKVPYESLITFVKDRPGHDFRYSTDASKLKSHTGWSPKMSFQEGLQKTVGWYIDQFEVLRLNSDARRRIGVG
jgi:dTDP-glucose 4,6-dehydratase